MHSKRPDNSRGHRSRRPANRRRLGGARLREEDLGTIPPPRAPEAMPVVLTPADLQRHWRALMGELEFDRSRLYVQIFTGDGRCTPFLLDVVDLPDLPDMSASDRLLQLCAQAIDDLGYPEARVAVLYARPGAARRRASDVAWARQLTRSAQRFRVPVFPIHVATHEILMAVPHDDLGRPA